MAEPAGCENMYYGVPDHRDDMSLYTGRKPDLLKDEDEQGKENIWVIM